MLISDWLTIKNTDPWLVDIYQVLVILPARELQQEDVPGVQEAGLGGRYIRIQVMLNIVTSTPVNNTILDMVSSACSDSTVMVWRRSSDQTCTEISRRRLWRTSRVVSCMDWRSSGPSWNITGEYSLLIGWHKTKLISDWLISYWLNISVTPENWMWMIDWGVSWSSFIPSKISRFSILRWAEIVLTLK